MTDEEIEKIALYLFLHKWLASPYTPGNLLLLKAAIREALAEDRS